MWNSGVPKIAEKVHINLPGSTNNLNSYRSYSFTKTDKCEKKLASATILY